MGYNMLKKIDERFAVEFLLDYIFSSDEFGCNVEVAKIFSPIVHDVFYACFDVDVELLLHIGNKPDVVTLRCCELDVSHTLHVLRNKGKYHPIGIRQTKFAKNKYRQEFYVGGAYMGVIGDIGMPQEIDHNVYSVLNVLSHLNIDICPEEQNLKEGVSQ